MAERDLLAAVIQQAVDDLRMFTPEHMEIIEAGISREDSKLAGCYITLLSKKQPIPEEIKTAHRKKFQLENARERRVIHDSAHAWIFNKSTTEHAFSFECLCLMLDLDAEAMRAGIRKKLVN